METFEVAGADGTRLLGRVSDGDGVPVLLCNGLGAPLVSWPVLAAPGSGFRVVTWDYRGLGGSARPADPSRIGVADHVADALAVMDAAGMPSAVVAGWSIGVNVAFELASVAPARVSALLAVAGVPGGTFSAMFGPLRRGARVRHAAALSVARGLRAAGPVVDRVARGVPLNRVTAASLRHSGAMHPEAGHDVLLPVLKEFREHDFRWYFTLAVAMADHRPMDLAFVRVPATLVAGRRDLLTSRHDLERAAARIPHAKLVVMDGSHFLPLERPDEIAQLVRELAVNQEA